jgi:hypothetical protein
MKGSSSKELRDPDPALAKRKTEIRVCVRKKKKKKSEARGARCVRDAEHSVTLPGFVPSYQSFLFSVCPKPRS